MGSKILASHSSSMFHERLPTNKDVDSFVASALGRLTVVSGAEVGASLRFFEGATSSSSSSSSSDDDSSSSSSSEVSSEESSSSEVDSLTGAGFTPFVLAGATSSDSYGQ
jgi:hypothetical protein